MQCMQNIPRNLNIPGRIICYESELYAFLLMRLLQCTVVACGRNMALVFLRAVCHIGHGATKFVSLEQEIFIQAYPVSISCDFSASHFRLMHGYPKSSDTPLVKL